jgi:hypothetical protein
MKGEYLRRENSATKEEKGEFYYGKGDDSLVENQIKTLAKAYTGFQLIMLKCKRTQKMEDTIVITGSEKADLFGMEKEGTNYFRKLFKERNEHEGGKGYKMQEESKRKENERTKETCPQKKMRSTEEEERKSYNGKGDESLVENQLKTLAKAYTGFQLIMLKSKRSWDEGKVIREVESGRKISQNNQSEERTRRKKSVKLEQLQEEKGEKLYYLDKGDNLLVENQFENLAKAVTGFQLIMLSNNEGQSIRTIDINTKSEVQGGQKEIIINGHKSSSLRIFIMSNAYSGIEQVSSELEMDEEKNTNTEIREAIERLVSIYMHYSIGNR